MSFLKLAAGSPYYGITFSSKKSFWPLTLAGLYNDTDIKCSSHIIDEIQDEKLGALAYFYFTFRRNERQDLRNLLHSLLTQLARSLVRIDEQQPHLYHVPRAFQQLYENYVFEPEPRIEDLKTAFLGILAESTATYIVIDALDECPVIKDRKEILQFLVEISSAESNDVHVLVTSRLEEDIDKIVSEISESNEVTRVPIQNSQVNNDIRRHVEVCLADDSQLNRWATDIKLEVADNLTSNAGGVFRWVECQLVTLGPKIRKKDVLEALNQLPKDLDC